MSKYTLEQARALAEEFATFSSDDQDAILSRMEKRKVKAKGKTLVGRKNPLPPPPAELSSHTDVPTAETPYDVPGIIQYPKDVTFAPEPFEPKPEKGPAISTVTGKPVPSI